MFMFRTSPGGPRHHRPGRPLTIEFPLDFAPGSPEHAWP